jgi:3-dehydroquinate synthase
MQRVGVETAGGSYDVVIDRGALGRVRDYIEPLTASRRLFVVADDRAWKHQGARFEKGAEGLDCTILQLESGEENKRLRQIEALADRMYAAGADRSACVVALGGGVAGDIAGFLAASYMRGVDVIQIPTTLLAQVDASVGGKTGVNLAAGKNLLGAFHQPRLVLIDPETLDTLPDREYRSGLFEVIKHGVIWSRGLFDRMREDREKAFQRDPQMLEDIIAESVRIKAEVVRRDEREGDLRRILNYGHTLGHALEAETEYRRLLHGEAVAYGMIAAAFLAESLGMLSESERAEITALVDSYGPVPSLEGVSAPALAARIAGDKKTVGGRVHFVLPDKIGQVTVVGGPHPDLVIASAEAALRACQAATESAPARQLAHQAAPPE